MPELPEVETIRRDLESSILNQEIVKFELRTASQFRGKVKAQDFFPGKKIKAINRVGKLLIFEVSEPNNYLLCHLRMTGQLIYALANSRTKTPTDNLPNKHTHITIQFEDSSKLYFNDIRKFGYMQLVNLAELEQAVAKFGIEPLTPNFTFNRFHKLTQKRSLNIKNFLLNQNLIAGIGNIYADEICFRSKIRPEIKVSALSKKQLQTVFDNCQKVIAQAIQERGTSFSDYRDGRGEKGNFLNFLQVYGRSGKNCYECQSQIQKTKVSGRGTHFCPNCQS